MTTEKRIAVIYATDFNSIAPGGIQNFIKLLAAENKNSSETTFFTRSAESRFHGSPNVQLKDNRFMNKMKIPNHLRFALSLRALKKDLREYDVLLLHRPEYALFIKHTKKILVLHGGSWNAMRAQGLLRGLLHLLIEFIAVNRSSLVISVNVEGQSDFIRKFIRIERAIKVPLNNTFVADKIRPNPSYIYSTSRLDPEKNIVNIIEISKLAEKSLILSGSGVLNQDSRFIGILQESKNVSYLGQRTPEELNQLYKSGGYFISLGVAEGYPLACVEAIASGLQVVTLKGLTGVSQLESYGAYIAPNIQDLVNFLKSNNWILTEEMRYQLIEDHQADKILRTINTAIGQLQKSGK